MIYGKVCFVGLISTVVFAHHRRLSFPKKGIIVVQLLLLDLDPVRRFSEGGLNVDLVIVLSTPIFKFSEISETFVQRTMQFDSVNFIIRGLRLR